MMINIAQNILKGLTSSKPATRRGPLTFKYDELKQRLAGMAEDDPLWPLLLGLVDECIRDLVEATVLPGLSDAELHRMRGRLGMMMDHRETLANLWEVTHLKTAG